MKKLLYLLILALVVSCAKPTTERPLIGISCGSGDNHTSLHLAYINAIYKAGGTPILIPALTDSVVLRDVLCRLDGIVMSGGEDVAPAYYGEEPHETPTTLFWLVWPTIWRFRCSVFAEVYNL